MTYAVFAHHRGLDRESEICRVDSEKSAEDIAADLVNQTIKEKLPDKRRAHSVPRYLSVRVQEVGA